MKVYDSVKLVDIDEIKPYWNNPRQNDKTVEQLKISIPKHGFNVPMLIDQDGVIVKGHARYYAAKQMGLNVVPCIISEGSEEQNKIDRIYDNAIQEMSEWDYDLLNKENADIEEMIEQSAAIELDQEINHIIMREENKQKEKVPVIEGVMCPGCKTMIKIEDIDGLI